MAAAFETYVERGDRFVDEGDMDSALAMFRAALALSPDDKFPIMQLAHARDKAGDEQGVLAAVRMIADQIEREDEATLDRLTRPRSAGRPPPGRA